MDDDLKKEFENLNKKFNEINEKLNVIEEKLDGHSLKEIFEICEANGQGVEGIHFALSRHDNEIQSLYNIVSQNNLRGSR